MQLGVGGLALRLRVSGRKRSLGKEEFSKVLVGRVTNAREGAAEYKNGRQGAARGGRYEITAILLTAWV